MHEKQTIRQVIDLTDPNRNTIFNMSVEDARDRVAAGDARRVREIDGHFALVAQRGHIVRMARSLPMPMRYFIVKRSDGPALVVSDRIDAIRNWLNEGGLADQFHPTYTRMVPAHYITEIALVGCPDPNPTYSRYFTPERETLPADPEEIGRRYIGAVTHEIAKWLKQLPEREPLGVCFSGGIDSGAIFLLTYHLMQSAGMNLGRLKAFTLDIEGGDDASQARRFLESMDLQMFLEPIEAPTGAIDL